MRVASGAVVKTEGQRADLGIERAGAGDSGHQVNGRGGARRGDGLAHGHVRAAAGVRSANGQGGIRRKAGVELEGPVVEVDPDGDGCGVERVRLSQVQRADVPGAGRRSKTVAPHAQGKGRNGIGRPQCHRPRAPRERRAHSKSPGGVVVVEGAQAREVQGLGRGRGGAADPEGASGNVQRSTAAVDGAGDAVGDGQVVERLAGAAEIQSRTTGEIDRSGGGEAIVTTRQRDFPRTDVGGASVGIRARERERARADFRHSACTTTGEAAADGRIAGAADGQVVGPVGERAGLNREGIAGVIHPLLGGAKGDRRVDGDGS